MADRETSTPRQDESSRERSEAGREEGGDVLARLERAWRRSDQIFALLAPEALHARPIRLRHPFVFYLGHLPAFGWNQVCRGLLRKPSFEPAFDELFERGIDPLESDAPEAADRAAWPSREAIVAYRDRVRDELRAALPEVRERAGDDVMAARDCVYHVVLEHELMHHETLMYMVQQLPHDAKRAPGATRAPAGRDASGAADAAARGAHSAAARDPADAPERIAVPAGRCVLGARFDELPFGWDNEFPELPVDVPAFAIDALPVSNARFLAFVESGGYRERRLWSADDWAAREQLGLEHPLFWSRRGGRWLYRTPFADIPLDEAADWPVYVSWMEAAAFARWSGARLPTEPEFHRAAYGTPGGALRRHPWGDAPPAPRHGNLGFDRWSPAPVGSHPAGASAFGVHELVGNGWEWTSTVFGPLPGFRAYMPHYPGYSADFFDERHYVMLGGSWATDRQLVRRSLRNWFQGHYPYVFAKFRCAASE